MDNYSTQKLKILDLSYIFINSSGIWVGHIIFNYKMKSHITSDYTFFCGNGCYQLGLKYLTFTLIDPITELIASKYNHKNDSPTSKELLF